MKKQEKEKSNLWVLFIPLGFLLFVYLYGEYKEDNLNQILMKKGHVIDCVIFDKGNLKGPDVIAKYFVNNIKYIERTGAPTKINIGEKFKIKYNIDNPEDAKILFDEPIIPKEYKITEGKIIDCQEYVFNRVTFSYDVDNITYEKEQVVKKCLHRGSLIKVRYDKKYPERSYLEN